MCCGQSASADCINAKQRWLRQVKSAFRTFELHTPHISVIKRKMFHMKKLKLDMNKLDIPEVINNSRIITETNFNFIYNIGIMWKYDKKVKKRLIL